jgi:L-amino acid N-acyltransferase YncA
MTGRKSPRSTPRGSPPVSDRCVYAGVAEDSIYVAERAWGHRIGRRLLSALVVILLERRSAIAGRG